MEGKTNELLFKDIDADDEPQTNAVESLCMNCHENGTTRILLTRIPFFREVVLMSFECPHCGYANNEIQSAGRIQDMGCNIKLLVSSPKDLNRQVVKSDSASFTIPELEFESPAFSQKGELTTIEGLLGRAITALEQDQPVRRIMDPDNAVKIDDFVAQLTKCRDGDRKFTLHLDDSSGNSFIENPHAPKEDPQMTMVYYRRNAEQNAQLGLQPASQTEEKQEEEEEEEEQTNVNDEVLNFPTNCPSCNAPTETRMKLVAIPHFKEVVIMATNCDACGHRSNEVKSGAGMEPHGTRLTLRITDPLDLNRDVLKSETCEVYMPSLDFHIAAGTLGGRFTTLEGLLCNIKDQLKSLNPFGFGDSPAEFSAKMKTFITNLDKVINGEEMNVVITLDDPAGNSYIQNLYAPDPDPELEIVHYPRTKEQEDDLGISDMKTEGYEEDNQS